MSDPAPTDQHSAHHEHSAKTHMNILSLHEADKTPTEIARELGIPRSSVQYTIDHGAQFRARGGETTHQHRARMTNPTMASPTKNDAADAVSGTAGKTTDMKSEGTGESGGHGEEEEGSSEVEKSATVEGKPAKAQGRSKKVLGDIGDDTRNCNREERHNRRLARMGKSVDLDKEQEEQLEQEQQLGQEQRVGQEQQV